MGGDVHYIIAVIGKEIVGASKVWKSHYQNYPFHSISYFKISDEHQNKGYASILADETFKFAKKNGLKLGVHDYTKDGGLKLKTLFNRKAKEYRNKSHKYKRSIKRRINKIGLSSPELKPLETDVRPKDRKVRGQLSVKKERNVKQKR